MLRVIIFSLVSLVVLLIGVRACGSTPEQREERAMLADLNLEEGLAYRSANRVRPGVVELAGGLQVEMLHEGSGPMPEAEDWVVVHYRGMHLDGRVFEDSRRWGETAVVRVDQTIDAWQRVLVALRSGSRIRMTVPPQLAYGVDGSGMIGPQETLVFELELIEIAPPPQRQDPSDPLQQRVPGLR